MKIMMCTMPIGPYGNDFPPFGSMAIIQTLRAAGYDPQLYDIDAFRPPFAEVVARFRAEQPDIIGISAVVSTAYGYVKPLCRALQEAVPDAWIVLGGNLAASAEILHRRCGVDVCVVGEGEKPMLNLVEYFGRHPHAHDYAELEQIKGITYLAPAGDLRFTGYDTAIPGAELVDPDFSILEQFSDIDLYVREPLTRADFIGDPRSHEPHRAGRKLASVNTAKGCVARCTFCHRWDRGFRQLPPEKILRRLTTLIERYNVGFIDFADENFGSDRRATDQLIELIEPLDLLWVVAGVRARSVDPDLLRRMRDAGCVAVYYGFESGSPEILKVMEKNLKLEDNLKAALATRDAGLFTIYQIILGMPGETPETVGHTIEMLKQITEFLPDPPYRRLSINFAQALPGTPLYEYARHRGLIGPTPDDEEAYLLSISDTAAGEDTRFLNFTGYPYLAVQSWRPRVLYETTVHWVRSRDTRARTQESAALRTARWGSYFNVLEFRYDDRWLVALYPLRRAVIWAWTFLRIWQRSPAPLYFRRLWEFVTWPLRRHDGLTDYASLRQIMKTNAPAPVTESDRSMIPLRLGR
jgi:radical SAM superfamily enzyme YgiQ (UPF0313 family)